MPSTPTSVRGTRISSASPVAHLHLIYRDYTLAVMLVTIALSAVLRISAFMKTTFTPSVFTATNGERGAQWTIESALWPAWGWMPLKR